MLCRGAQTWIPPCPETRTTCLPSIGQHENSPPGGKNVFLGMGICISLPSQGNTTANHPMSQQCTRHTSFLSDLIPMEEGSHPRARNPCRTPPTPPPPVPPRRAGITTHQTTAASETSGSSATRPDLGQAQLIHVPTQGIPTATLRDTTHP